MTPFDPNQTVGSVVTAAPGTARVFERLGLDYCCGGKSTLADACVRRGLETDVVLAELEAALARPAPARELTRERASAVVEHIVETHHTFVKRELPRLVTLMEKVNRVHGATHPQLPTMAAIWFRVAAELEQHLAKEEEILFPMIRALDAGRAVTMHCGVEGPMHVMELEHEEVGEALHRLRALADDYRVPADACGSWRALWAGLDEFERDLHMHVHLENNVLFPKVRELEA